MKIKKPCPVENGISPVYSSVDEFAREIGISRNMAYTGLREGTIPAIRIGKRFIIPRAAVRAWYDTCINPSLPRPADRRD
jgi:excisionase family DNA binding protein